MTMNKRGGCLQGCAALAVAGLAFGLMIYVFKVVGDWLQGMYGLP